MNLLEILGLILIGIVVLAFIMAIPVAIYETYGNDIKKYFKEKKEKKTLKEINKIVTTMDKYLENNFREIYINYAHLKGSKSFEEFVFWLYRIDFTQIEKLEEELK